MKFREFYEKLVEVYAGDILPAVDSKESNKDMRLLTKDFSDRNDISYYHQVFNIIFASGLIGYNDKHNQNSCCFDIPEYEFNKDIPDGTIESMKKKLNDLAIKWRKKSPFPELQTSAIQESKEIKTPSSSQAASSSPPPNNKSSSFSAEDQKKPICNQSWLYTNKCSRIESKQTDALIPDSHFQYKKSIIFGEEYDSHDSEVWSSPAQHQIDPLKNFTRVRGRTMYIISGSEHLFPASFEGVSAASAEKYIVMFVCPYSVNYSYDFTESKEPREAIYSLLGVHCTAKQRVDINKAFYYRVTDLNFRESKSNHADMITMLRNLQAPEQNKVEIKKTQDNHYNVPDFIHGEIIFELLTNQSAMELSVEQKKVMKYIRNRAQIPDEFYRPRRWLGCLFSNNESYSKSTKLAAAIILLQLLKEEIDISDNLDRVLSEKKVSPYILAALTEGSLGNCVKEIQEKQRQAKEVNKCKVS